MSELSPKHALVVGMGSIGKRHFHWLETLGFKTVSVSKHLPLSETNFHSIQTALSSHAFQYIVIANSPKEHVDAMLNCFSAHYLGAILIEKPLFLRSVKDLEVLRKTSKVYVGYNLRFHPALQKLKEMLKDERPLTLNAYVGKYLPEWRDTPYEKSISASKTEGGGVLLDLSHELDYVSWLFGQWKKVVAIGGKLSQLEVSSDDSFHILAEFENCPAAQIELNYLDRIHQRYFTIITNRHTFKVDFIRHTLQVDKEIEHFDVRPETTYLKMHEAILEPESHGLCRFIEGNQTLKMIEAILQSSVNESWVRNA